MSSSDIALHTCLPTAGILVGWLNIGICLIRLVYCMHIMTDMPEETLIWVFYLADLKKQMVYIILSAYVTYVILDIVTCILLLIGIQKSRSKYVLPWIFLHVVAIGAKLSSVSYLLKKWVVDSKPPLDRIGLFFNVFYTVCVIGVWVLMICLYKYLAAGPVEEEPAPRP